MLLRPRLFAVVRVVAVPAMALIVLVVRPPSTFARAAGIGLMVLIPLFVVVAVRTWIRFEDDRVVVGGGIRSSASFRHGEAQVRVFSLPAGPIFRGHEGIEINGDSGVSRTFMLTFFRAEDRVEVLRRVRSAFRTRE